jgi:P27 family predicted phage terminase small subunit
MGRRGPKPTPGKILEMRGSWRGKKRRKTEPVVDTSAILRPPSWLSTEAKVIFNQVVKHLAPIGILARVDTNALARYATLLEQFKTAAKFVEDNGQTYMFINAKGHSLSHIYPQMKLLAVLHAQLLGVEREMGMTPAARANFGSGLLAQPKSKSSKDRFFTQ